MFIVLLSFLITFPISRNKLLWDGFSGLSLVNKQGIDILSYNEFRFVAISYMSYNIIDCILSIEGNAVGVLSWYFFVSNFVVWTPWLWSTVGRWVSSHGRCVDNARVCDCAFDAMCVDHDGIG